MNIGVLKHVEISYEMHLEIAFYKNNGRGYQKILTIVGCPRSADFAVCSKFFKSKTRKSTKGW